MSETAFPINDLLRRKMQTSLVIVSLALCVASTLFLLLSAERIGFGVSLTFEGRMTAGISSMFSSFVLFLVVLVVLIGIVIASFTAHAMMSQRTKDIGLMKAVGCPNDLLFGYFFTELLIVSFVGCILGSAIGLTVDFVSSEFLARPDFQGSQGQPNLWLVLIVFAVFFVLTLIIGTRPFLNAAKIEPIKAISPTQYFGLEKARGFNVVPRFGISLRMGLRSLYRHRTATVRLVVSLSSVFLLVTVAVAGGMIADSTTRSWIDGAIERDTVLIAHKDITGQYRFLISEFYDGHRNVEFNYTDERYLLSFDIVDRVHSILGDSPIDARLILKAPVAELEGILLGNTTADTKIVGHSRRGDSLIIGVDPQITLSKWYVNGRFPSRSEGFEAVVGDTLARRLFDVPLVQSIRTFNQSFAITGVCIDPIDNGNVTYVPIKTLQNISGVTMPNIIMINIGSTNNKADLLNRLRTSIGSANSEIEVTELNDVLNSCLALVGYTWSTILLLPLFSLIAAILCLLSYVMLTISEQRQEFGVLRALGAKPKTVVNIISWQSLVISLSSYAVGVAFGIIATLMVLIQDPLITIPLVVTIAGWLAIAFATTSLSSLYPAMKFARKSILEIINQS